MVNDASPIGNRAQRPARSSVPKRSAAQRRPNRRYQASRHLTRNQQEVARRLSVGHVDLVTISGWGFVASFLAFLDRLEYGILLDFEDQGFLRVMIPISRLIVTDQLKILLAIPSMNLVPTKLFERLLDRSVSTERGLALIVHDGSAGLEAALARDWFGEGVELQRCVFHKLMNVRRDVVGAEEMSPTERRHEVLRTAAVSDGPDAIAIGHRLGTFHAKWAEREPHAVATLERDFERTLTYLAMRERAR